MAYGLKYILNYDGGPQGNEPYTLEFHFKNYTGTFYNMIGVQATVVHSWDKDEPKPGVKGSALDISLLNKNGSLPLSNFFSVTDDNCKVIHKWHDQVLFSGFLVQDDCSEVMVDFSHSINLKATDNLGLLKDVPLDKANLIVGDGNRVITGIQVESNGSSAPFTDYLIIYSITTGGLVGDTLILEGTNGSDGIYIVKKISTAGSTTYFTLDRKLPFFIASSTTYTVTFITAADLRNRLSLAYIIRICLYSTTVNLNTDVYSNIIEKVTATPRFLEETFISGNDFSNGNNDFKSCYDVLTIIMERFNATLFQAEGAWNIIRRDEHRYYDNLITGFRYNSSMVYMEDIEFTDIFTAEPNFDPTLPAPATYNIYGLRQSILRPFNFDKETFNYKQPDNLLCNYNLQILGPYIGDFTAFGVKYTDYEMPCWFNGPFAAFPGRRIRVGVNIATGFEVSRTAVISGLTGDSSRSAGSAPIDANIGDICEFGYSFRTDGSQAGPIFFIIAFGITNGIDTYYLQDDDTWSSTVGPGKRFNVPTGSNTNQWQTMNITTSPFPITGKLTVYINDHINAPTSLSETYIRDLTFTYTPLINESQKIIGHTHTDTQQPVIKNNEDVEIYIDDSPRNSIAGTMFLSTFTGLLQNRTLQWGYAPGGLRRLGEITTFEQLFWRRVPRTKMEGTMYGVIQPTASKTVTSTVDFYMLSTPSLLYGIHAPLVPSGQITIGSTITVTGSASNNGIFTVIGIWTGLTLFPIGTYMVQEAIVTEPGATGVTLQFNPRRHISMLTLLKYTGLPGLNFIFGTLSIDHKYNKFNGTFWEQWADGEVDADLISNYNFKYLYETK